MLPAKIIVLILAIAVVGTEASQRRRTRLDPSKTSGVTCTTTLNSGGDVNTAITNAAGGSVICLNNGTYTINTTASKSSTVTIKSTTGVGATITTLNASNINNLKFDHLTIESLEISGTSTNNVMVSNSVQSPTAASYWEHDCRDYSGSKNIIYDGNTHTNAYHAQGATLIGLEGRLSITGGNGVSGDRANCGGLIIRNSRFEGTASDTRCSDGIFLQAGNIVIGPGNYFTALYQNGCTAHVDAIQAYDSESGIYVTGNYFYDNQVGLGWYDHYDGNGDLPFEITDNTFDSCHGGDDPYDNMLLSFDDMLIEHNTFYGCSINVGSKAGDPVNVRWTIRNNIFDNGSSINSDSQGGGTGGCGVGCVNSFNLLSNGGSTYLTCTSCVTGTASYSGTPKNLANWSYWLLSGGSPGENAGSDGQDMGTRLLGPYTGPS